MNRKPMLVAVLWTVVSCCSLPVYASKRPRVPTMQDLATVWVGGSDLEYLRLELTEAGTGVLTIQYLPQKGARAYRVTATVLRQDRVTLATQPLEPEAEPIEVGGDALAGRLELRVAAKKSDWNRTYILQPLSDLMARLEAVTKRAQEVAK